MRENYYIWAKIRKKGNVLWFCRVYESQTNINDYMHITILAK